MTEKRQTFVSLYRAELAKPKPKTPGKQFIADIAKVTRRSEATVFTWLSEGREPDILAKIAISRHLDVPVDDLFPKD